MHRSSVCIFCLDPLFFVCFCVCFCVCFLCVFVVVVWVFFVVLLFFVRFLLLFFFFFFGGGGGLVLFFVCVFFCFFFSKSFFSKTYFSSTIRVSNNLTPNLALRMCPNCWKGYKQTTLAGKERTIMSLACLFSRNVVFAQVEINRNFQRKILNKKFTHNFQHMFWVSKITVSLRRFF